MRTFTLVLLLFSVRTFAQPVIEDPAIIDQITENISEALIETGQTELPDELQKLSSNKLDINSEEIELLVAAGLLNRNQCDAIRNHIMHYGKLAEMEELQQVSELSKTDIRRILPFADVYSSKEIQPKTALTLRYQQSMMNQINYYNGSLSRVMLRLKSVVNSHFTFGLTCEKDEGEEMFTRRTPAFDFTSAFVSYSGNKFIRKIVLGDYNLEFGQGLNMWSGLSFGGTSTVTSLFKSGRGIVPYTGTDENRFFRGVAVSLRKKNIQLDAWASYHPVDANKYTDTITGETKVTSLQYSGYHRSYAEKFDYHSQTESSAGVHLKYSFARAEAGFISSGQTYSLPITGNDYAYSHFSFRGDRTYHLGFYYNYSFRNIILFGEQSLTNNNSIAWLNGIILSIDPRFSLGFLHRSYPKDFSNNKSNAFGVSSSNTNEHGNYFTVNYSIRKSLLYSVAFDMYSFPFLKYKVDGPSRGTDLSHTLDFKPNKKFVSQLRYRVRNKQENSPVSAIGNYKYESVRLSFTTKIDNGWSYGMRFERLLTSLEDERLGEGTMVSQDIFFKPMGKRYSFNFRYAIFHCSQFENRIYEYENDVPGSFSVPFYYGDGSRFYINANLRVGRRINLSTRYSKTWQENKADFSEKSDIKIQMRVSL